METINKSLKIFAIIKTDLKENEPKTNNNKTAPEVKETA